MLFLYQKMGYAIKSVVDYTGIEPLIKPPVEYTVSSAFKSNVVEYKVGWFALINIEKVVLNKGDYINTNGIGILDSLGKIHI